MCNINLQLFFEIQLIILTERVEWIYKLNSNLSNILSVLTGNKSSFLKSISEGGACLKQSIEIN